MHDTDERRTSTDVAAERPEPGLGMAVLAAVVSLVVAGAKVAVWANRWYVAGRFSQGDAESTRLLLTGNRALLQGFVMIGFALTFASLAHVLRRRRAPVPCRHG